MVETGHMLTPSTGLGTRRRIRLGAQVSRVIKPERFSTRACQLLHGVSQLLYEVHLLTASEGVAGGHKFSWP